MHLGKRCSARNSGTYCQPAANCGFNGKESGRAGTSSRPAGLFSQFKFNDLFVEHHIFLFYDHIQLIRRALAEPDVVSSDTDTILGRADLWDGRYIEARLCGRPGQTALLAVVLYDFGGELQTYRNSTEYQTGFEFTHEGMEFIVGFVPEERRKRHE